MNKDSNDWFDENSRNEMKRKTMDQMLERMENPPRHAQVVSEWGATIIIGGILLVFVILVIVLIMEILGV